MQDVHPAGKVAPLSLEPQGILSHGAEDRMEVRLESSPSMPCLLSPVCKVLRDMAGIIPKINTIPFPKRLLLLASF